jgi:Tol biopolymer transport system component
MGEVYRARDTKLGREVAIKILPVAFRSDPDRLARFEREARSLAALNHPNIAAIYGVEEQPGLNALILELVEGETLAERIKLQGRVGLHVPEALAIARQIADALDAAHERGIVHRDLKPANIKITPAGAVKVLDFGLAKAVSDDRFSPDLSQSPTVTSSGTRAGVILGTAAYMSPEQARGKTVDKRADIWGFGCVLFEALTGRVAFQGDTLSDVMVSVLEREPDWSLLPAGTPGGIRRLLQRCLEKDLRRRLHDIADARVEIEDVLAGVAQPAGPAPDARRREHPYIAWIVAGVVAIATFVIGRTVKAPAPTDAAPTFSRVVRLTTGPAKEIGPAISPDGKWVAYLSNARGPSDVWVKFTAGGDAVNLTASTNLDVSGGTGQGGPSISPDGTRIAVIARVRGGAGGYETWEIPAPLPGVPRKLVDGVGLSWSPDGRQITFIRGGGLAGDALFVADADGTNRREIVKAHDGQHIHWPAWSRDGYLYVIRSFDTTTAGVESAEIYRIDPRGGPLEPVVSTTRRAMFPAPMPNSNGLIFAANPTAADLSLWWRAPNGAETRRLTLGVGEYAEPRISADGRTLVATLYESRQALTRIDMASAQMSPITDGYDGDLDPSIAPQGDRIVFSSTRDGNRHLWMMAIDGRDARPLTSGPSLDAWPNFSPDGQQIAFVSDRSGRRAIWLINADGGAPRKVLDVAPLGAPRWSSDGRQLVYSAGTGDFPGLWTVSIADGRTTRLSTEGAAGEPEPNPTRDLIAHLIFSTSGPSVVRLGFVASTGQFQYTALAPPPIAGGFASGTLAWAPDGRRLAVVAQPTNGVASVWIVEPDASHPYRKLIELPLGPRIRGLAWTRDGSALIFGRHETSSDIVMLDQLK